MGKVRFHTNYDIKVDIDTEKSVDVYIDTFELTPVPEDNIRIVIIIEPRDFKLIDLVQSNPGSYTYVLNPYEIILNNNPKAHYFLSANTWVDPFFDYKKKFCVSTIVSGKDRIGFEGYVLRRELWRRQREIVIQKNFYLSSDVKLEGADYKHNLVLPHTDNFKNSKIPMFDCMFHIAIENTSINNYFTEKIIDCFLSRTVPIYYGDKNIGNHFNSNGIIEVNNVNEIIGICNRLDISVYERMLPLLNDNYESALEYQDYNVRIRNEILKYINDTV